MFRNDSGFRFKFLRKHSVQLIKKIGMDVMNVQRYFFAILLSYESYSRLVSHLVR